MKERRGGMNEMGGRVWMSRWAGYKHELRL